MSLGETRKATKKIVRHHQLQHCIAKKLETLIGRLILMLGTPRTVCQRMGEKIGIVEPIPESILKGCQKRSRAQRSAELGDDILDGVTNCTKVFEIFIFDTKTN